MTDRRAEALEILETWRNRPDRESRALAVMCAGLGQTDEAMEWLNTAVQERSSQVCLLKFDPRLDSLRDDPRFDELLRRMNFPE